MEGPGGLGEGKLRVTTEWLIFEPKRMFGGAGDVTSFPLSSIQSAGLSGMFTKTLKVRAGSTDVAFRSAIAHAGDTNLKAINDLLQRSIAGHPLGSPVQAPCSPAPPPTPLAPSTADWLDEIERLAKLHTAGVLTDDEFAQAKRKLLDS